jgi:transposase
MDKSRKMRPECDVACQEWRRFQALSLHKAGWTQRDIAVALDVTKGAVSQWLAAARAHGSGALHSRARPGRPGELSPEQKHLLPDCLWHGAEAYGFRGERWTCARVAKVVEQEFGIAYSKSQVSRILKAMGWTPQVPITRAIQRDEEAIAHWRAWTWPALKKRASHERRTLVLMDESGFYLLPGVVKTYAPKGRTPVLQEWQSKDHLSVMGGITPQGKIYTLVRQRPLNGLHTVEFLEHLMRMAGQRLLVVLDRSPIHRRTEVKEFVAQTKTVHLEMLPPYAPDLNPAEWMWRHLKQIEMCNLTCLNLDELHIQFDLALKRLRRKTYLMKSFFSQAGLTL